MRAKGVGDFKYFGGIQSLSEMATREDRVCVLNMIGGESGALGGDAPADTLRKGSIAILSNSGGFTTTMAQYLRMAGWGTTALISSGKDVYIHYAAREFAFALANDDRSKAAVLYCEPGGYYERDASVTKPVVTCLVARWKSKLTRAVGHAGAMERTVRGKRAGDGRLHDLPLPAHAWLRRRDRRPPEPGLQYGHAHTGFPVPVRSLRERRYTTC